jgi:hypothetical protein
MTQLATRIASTLQAIANCDASGNTEWHATHTERLDKMIRDHMPSGSGFDAGTTLDDSSKPERLVFVTSFHHMDESGGYDGWTEHKVIVTASLVYGIDVRVTGRDRNSIKDYIGEVFTSVLTTAI